ncbi:IdgA domain protein [Paecilomyces variotii No. 5]|uniref:IdgA domain protein n=1 Tax=Byssochlamys spectabilis (strain No. 5 / NBRC 109023) TaxID=1356009 RepID=V5FML5_BYSSN|nr:IdgA domain protein [Paecilomyces variotii No. 5]
MFTSRAAARVSRWPVRRPLVKLPRPSRNYHDLAQSKFFKVAEEVRDAVATGKPVVALETTIYTHGFPYPENVALASLLESVIRVNGGVPASIGIFNGVARVGLEAEELIELCASAEKKSALKVSRRDLGYICGLGLVGKPVHGGTTISGTMVLAHLAGVKIFGTGGLGGVHRGGEHSMDISADLTELGRTPVTVISSGCKSFLDIPRTLEYLETEGVCVGTFADGREGPVDFPAFFTRESGVRSPKVIQNEEEAAAIVFAQSRLPVTSGIHFANPVPQEHSIAKAEMDKIIEEAVRLADVEGYHGSDNTPFILSKIKELSGGKSVVANRALVESNVKRATKVAVELAKLEKSHKGSLNRQLFASAAIPTATTSSTNSEIIDNSTSPDTANSPTEHIEKADVLIAGSLAIDFSCDYAPLAERSTEVTPVPHTSNPAIIGQSLGGVGHNVALAASYVGRPVIFCSVVGNDFSGRAALSSLEREKLTTGGIKILPSDSGARTAQYVAVNDGKKDLVLAMADMSIMEFPSHDLNFDGFWEPMLRRTKPKWVVVDGNWSSGVLANWVAAARKHGARVAFEPVSTAKSTRLFSKGLGQSPVIGPEDAVPNHMLSLATPNNLELTEMYTTAREAELFDSPNWFRVIDALGMSNAGSREKLVSITDAALVKEGIPQQSIQLLPYIPAILTKLGSRGVLLTQLLRPRDPRLTDPKYAPYILSRASTDDDLVGGVYMRLFPPDEVLVGKQIVSVNGAGDTLLGVVVAGLAKETGKKGDRHLEDIVPIAQKGSLRTLQSQNSVSEHIKGLSTLLEAL